MLIPLTPLTVNSPFQTSSDVAVNTCVLVGTDGGTVYGFKKSTYGSVSPVALADGTIVHTFEVESTTGVFTFAFGTAGDEKAYEANELAVYATNGESNIAVWSDALSVYTFTDTDWSAVVVASVGEVICMNVVITPIALIEYSFEEVGTT